MRFLIAFFVLVFFITYPCSQGFCEEASSPVQEKTLEEGDSSKKLKKPSFFRYIYRILISPIALFLNFPTNEDPDLYNYYVDFVNKGTDRNYKRRDYEIKKKKVLPVYSNEEENENEPNQEAGSQGES